MVARVLVCGALGAALAASPAGAQNRIWTAEDRSLVTSFADAAALALGRDRLYVASDDGVAVFDALQQRWLPPLAPVPGYPQGLATALAYDAVADGLWLGLENGELYQLSFAFGEWVPAAFRADDAIIRIRPDAAEGVLWVGTPVGWYRVRDDGDFGRFILRADMLPDEVRRSGEQNSALLAVQGTLGLDEQMRRFPLTDAVPGDEPGVFYVGTAGGGVVRVNANTLERTWLAFGTLSRGVGAIELAGGRIWFGGDGQGPRNGVAAAARDLSTWARYEAGVAGAPAGFVARIVPRGDALWFAASDGVYRFFEDAWTRTTSADGLPADQATTVLPTPAGAWVGTLRGLAAVDAVGTVVSTALVGSRVLDLAAAGDTLWIATDRGLFMAKGQGAPAPAPGTGAAPALASGPVVAVAASSAIVAALTPDGLYRLEGARWSAPDRAPSAAGLGDLLRLRIDTDGTLWIAGQGGVVALEVGAPPRTWLVPDDIPEGPVRGLALDGDDLWVATPGGALRIDRTR